jgi:hypothetical protein
MPEENIVTVLSDGTRSVSKHEIILNQYARYVSARLR